MADRTPQYTDADILRAVEEARRRAYAEVVVQIHEGRVVRVKMLEIQHVKPGAV